MTGSEIERNIEEAARLLIDRKLFIALAESATAGRVAFEFSVADDAGKFLKGGLVCYDACLKSDLLDVSQAMLDLYTPESMEVTAAIAEGLVKLISADIHIGITGLPCAGGSETAEKPVGTMFVYALLKNQKLFAERKVFQGSHRDIVLQTADLIAKLLIEHLPPHI